MQPEQKEEGQKNPDAPQDTPEAQSVEKPDEIPTDPAAKKPFPAKMMFIIAGLFILGGIALIAYFLSQGSTSKTTDVNSTGDAGKTTIAPQQNTADSLEEPREAKLMLYGAWNGQASLIKALDLSTQQTTLVATLPLAIKKVSVLSNQSLIYIDGTDTRDHGKQLTIYDLKTKSQKAVIPASTGFGIDDYVLSPDKKFAAVWEVSFAPGSQILQGGKSRVFTVDLTTPTVKNVLYDETSGPGAPIHYPRAILNNGRVFTDTFLPNDPKGGAGWAYGMSVANFDGSGKQNLSQMQEGTYGTQPTLSTDGKYLVFTGYDGSRGDGKAVKNGYRQALLTPNTVELLDTATLARQKLPNLDNKNSYTASSWDTTNTIILTVLSKDPNQTGTFGYDLPTKTLNKITLPRTKDAAYRHISNLPGERTLIATSEDKESNLGNLGDEYAYALTTLAILNNKNALTNVELQDQYIQYISLLPATYFNDVLGTTTISRVVLKPTIIDLYSDKNSPKPNTQLYTFFLKAELELIRVTQQSTPNTSVVTSSTPAAPKAPTVSAAPKPSGGLPAAGQNCQLLAESQCQAAGIIPSSAGFQDCITANREDPVVKCSDSPLYLYGPAGTHVQVAIQTPIFNAQPASAGEYDITLGTNGAMHIANAVVSSIAYDYKPNLRRITQPARGTTVHKSNVEKVLREYAAKLGLTPLETADLVQAGKAKITADYAFISFFDQATSEQILPIRFNPQPDNYVNVVFYFKNLTAKPAYTPLPPVFPAPINRSGFTAVEISEIVE